MSFFLPVLLGTAREGRRSEAVAQFVLEQVAQLKGVETLLVDARDYRIRGTDDTETTRLEKRFAKIVTEADGFIIVSLEYNHSFPGELKMMLDMADDEYAGKPVGICGVSSGGMGGVRMVEQLRLVTITLGMVPISSAMYFSNVEKLFDAEGVLLDQKFVTRLKPFFHELLWYVEALKAQRKKTPLSLD